MPCAGSHMLSKEELFLSLAGGGGEPEELEKPEKPDLVGVRLTE